jgi:hypothetical protein
VTLATQVLETTDMRVLGALRCVDASTGAPLTGTLTASAAGTRLMRNRSGLFVVLRQAALAAHEAAFAQPPALPALGSIGIDVTLRDPAGRYLPRRVRLPLPRDPDPANRAQPDSLFRPLEVPMYPAPAATPSANWAVLRVSLRHDPSGDALGGALIRVRDGATVLARALTDWRGEALVGVPGVPVTTWGEGPGPVLATELPVELDVVFDPARGQRRPVAELDDPSRRPPATAQPVVDPDAIEADFIAAAPPLPAALVPVVLATGRHQTLSLVLATP